MTQYEQSLNMGNGNVMTLVFSNERSVLKYDRASYAESTIIAMTQAKQLGLANRGKHSCFPVADRMTAIINSGAVGSESGEPPNHYPAVLALLLDITKACMIHGKSPRDALLDLASAQKQMIESPPTSDEVDIPQELDEEYQLVSMVLDDHVLARYKRSTNGRVIPAHLHLASNPVLSGVVAFRLLYLHRTATWQEEINVNLVGYAVQLYNLLLQLRGLQEAWDDAELLIAKLGCKVIFGQDIRPSKWSDILCCGECSEAKDHVEQLSKSKECMVLCCVATTLVATALVCLHDVSLMYICCGKCL
jgi:hypothetical protein